MLVLTGISAVAWTMYVYIVPFLYQTQHPMIFALYFIYGHYLLMNICYHYYRGVYTSPGTAPKVCVCVWEGGRLYMCVSVEGERGDQ